MNPFASVLESNGNTALNLLAYYTVFFAFPHAGVEQETQKSR
jgi:hypothetical protein